MCQRKVKSVIYLLHSLLKYFGVTISKHVCELKESICGIEIVLKCVVFIYRQTKTY